MIKLFGADFRVKIQQILIGTALKEVPRLIWANAVKALLTKIWFERNERVFHDKRLGWMDHIEVAVLNASSWCTISKHFEDFSI